MDGEMKQTWLHTKIIYFTPNTFSTLWSQIKTKTKKLSGNK